jgi:protein-L-isoaspartate(D-aspartate) O-methyltransferase
VTKEERDAIGRMIATQIEARGIADRRVLDAMARVNRFRFVPWEYRAFACSDGPIPLASGQTISQPYVVAKMTELLELTPKSRTLEIGTGSGYQTAVLACLAGEVWSVEIIASLSALARENLADPGYQNAHLVVGDGYEGYAPQAPYDAIIVTAAPPAIPGALIDQLANGGRLVIPVGVSLQSLLLVVKDATGTLREREIFPVAFVPMVKASSEK